MAVDSVIYSIVVPIYRDHYLLDSFCTTFHDVFTAAPGVANIDRDVELIFVTDGGGKADEAEVRRVCTRYPYVKGILLSRNFGQHIALTAGYQAARGDMIAMLNVDQQDPISELPKFFQHLQQHKLDIVYGLRDQRNSSWKDRMTSGLFNIVLNKLTGSDTPLNVSTMRVMSRRFIDAYNQLNESDRYLPGLEHWLGYEVGYIDTIHRERTIGQSSYTFRKRLNMAVNSILGFSDYPLRIMAIFGFILAALGMIGVLAIIFLKLFAIDFQAGYASLISVIVSCSGFIIFVVGLSSLYVGKILREVQRRPVYLAKERIKLP